MTVLVIVNFSKLCNNDNLNIEVDDDIVLSDQLNCGKNLVSCKRFDYNNNYALVIFLVRNLVKPLA